MEKILNTIMRPFGTRFGADVLPKINRSFESMKRPNGAFIAAPHPHYEACWIRDQLYCTLCYYYTGDIKKLKEGVQVIFDIFHKHSKKINSVIKRLPREGHEYIHAKYHPETFDEIVYEWGHHQLDAIGLFLYIVGFAHSRGITLIRCKKDAELLQQIVLYLEAVRYWEFPDNGMWEEGMDLHASSIGAVVAGLTLIREAKLAVVDQPLVLCGLKTLYGGGEDAPPLLPNESPTRDADMAQLSLIWPYAVATPDVRDEILARVQEKLLGRHGLHRYLGDEYYRSGETGACAEWPMGFFWLSIVKNELGDKTAAKEWFERGCAQTTAEGFIPELYTSGTPNEHTPLAWAHSMAIIAAEKLKR